MMTATKRTTRTILTSIGAAGILTAGALYGTGNATAHSADEYDSVRQVLCSDAGATIDVTYTNAYGNITSRDNVRIVTDSDNPRACTTLDLTAGEYGQYVTTTIVDSDGGYTYCAIYDNGTKVSESEDTTADTLSYAACY